MSTPKGQIWQRFRRNPLAIVAAAVILLLVIIAAAADVLATSRPLLVRGPDGIRVTAFARDAGDAATLLGAPVPYDPSRVDLLHRLEPPSRNHWLGTDELGRDVLARMIHGSRISLSVGIVAAGIALLVGVLIGALAGYYGGAADWIVSRLIEIVLCFPFLFLVLAIIALVRPSIWSIMIALGLTSWTTEARFVRGEFLRVREMEFAQAAKAMGARDVRIILWHLLPNAIAPALVSASFGVASAILVESALSFLGFGVPLPQASWGSILSSADDFLTHAWWLALFPGLAIFLTVTAYNIVGEQLRDALDPTT
ncbi:MAG: ABC transporter permease [Thermoanaerobaculia bacterium]